MELATRPWITASVVLALASASVLPATAVAAPLPDLSDLQTRAVQLAGAEDVT